MKGQDTLYSTFLIFRLNSFISAFLIPIGAGCAFGNGGGLGGSGAGFAFTGDLRFTLVGTRGCSFTNFTNARTSRANCFKFGHVRLFLQYAFPFRTTLVSFSLHGGAGIYYKVHKFKFTKIIIINLKEIVEIKNRTKHMSSEPKLILGDCLVEMKKIPDRSIHMILCDLPYGMTKNKWDTALPFEALWKEYNRIIRDNGAIVLFGSQPFTSLLITSNLKWFRYCLVWEKNKFSDFLNAKRKPMKTNEDICIFYKKQPTYHTQYWYSTPYERWNTQKAVDKQTNYGTHKENVAKSDGKRLPTTVLRFNRVERPKHPTQKPVDLLEWLIRSYTNENDVVLDNCMGVGSTGVACNNTNRSFIGMEINEAYFTVAKERITSVQQKTS